MTIAKFPQCCSSPQLVDGVNQLGNVGEAEGLTDLMLSESFEVGESEGGEDAVGNVGGQDR
ncbi:hypothetical protein AMK32_30890 [Streptomyces sp. CB01883]|nr:hypothetical protein AMK32_30890 [Streptomyces sp. CB01883]